MRKRRSFDTLTEREKQIAWQRKVIREEYIEDEAETHMAANKELYYGKEDWNDKRSN